MPKLDWSVLERPGLDRTLGLEYQTVSETEVTAVLEVDERHLQPFGYLHGGVNAALAESVASVGANVAAPAGFVAFGQSINASHLRPVRAGERLTYLAWPLHVGRLSQVWNVEVRDRAGRLVCASRCTLALVPTDA